jgi:beta-phosphoglucomutase
METNREETLPIPDVSAINDRRIDAVFWDFDGVIARTENLHIAAWQRLVNHVEIGLPRSMFRAAATEDDRDLIVQVFARMKIELSQTQILQWCLGKQRILETLLETSSPLYAGVAEAMLELDKAGVRQAVVTNTWRRNVELTLKGSGLLGHMEFIIAKEDVARTKPDPEGYQQAVQRMSVAGRRCLAIEDSTTGLVAARAAGVSTLAIAHPFSPAAVRNGDWAQGTTILTDIGQIKNWI